MSQYINTQRTKHYLNLLIGLNWGMIRKGKVKVEMGTVIEVMTAGISTLVT